MMTKTKFRTSDEAKLLANKLFPQPEVNVIN